MFNGEANRVTEITLSDEQFFTLPTVVENLLKENQNVKEDGFFAFKVAEGSGPGTLLDEFLRKYDLSTSFKKLNPIVVPDSPDFYSHISLDSDVLETEDLTAFIKTMSCPENYAVSPENCCISAMNESGLEGLLNHYFCDQLPLNSTHPPQFKPFYDEKNTEKMAMRSIKTFLNWEKKLQSLHSANEMASEMTKLLASSAYQKKEQNAVLTCSCWQCSYSDEPLKVVEEEDGLEFKVRPDAVATAHYYKGKGFYDCSAVNVESSNRNMVTGLFSLSYLNNISILSLLRQHFPGVNSPFLYFGGVHSFFPIHVEYLSLFSISFLHYGYPKLWIIVPPTSVGKLWYFLSKEFTCQMHGSCIGLLGHKYHLPTPAWLVRKGIPFKVFIQNCGQGIVLIPNAAHFGFNFGPNIAESTNFATLSWIPYGIVYPSCTCLLGQVHADIREIVKGFRPEMLNAYLCRKIPKVRNDPHFRRSLIYYGLWIGAYDAVQCESLSVGDDEGIAAVVGGSDCDAEDVSEESENVSNSSNALRKRKRPNRKLIKCPACDVTYQGGHKQRLEHHIDTTHSSLCAEKLAEIYEAFHELFPAKQLKLSQKRCPICGKAVARSMKAHQQSKGCKPLESASSTN